MVPQHPETEQIFSDRANNVLQRESNPKPPASQPAILAAAPPNGDRQFHC